MAMVARTSASDWSLLDRQLAALLAGELDPIACYANTSALLFASLPDINWVGFYLGIAGELVLGPFQGKPACTRIAFGSGVCGTAAATRESIIVPDVHAFVGHIVCDSDSSAELVVPMIDQVGRLMGVLDIDSPLRDRFHETDRLGLESVVTTLVGHLAS